jgi:hypothetical protein
MKVTLSWVALPAILLFTSTITGHVSHLFSSSHIPTHVGCIVAAEVIVGVSSFEKVASRKFLDSVQVKWSRSSNGFHYIDRPASAPRRPAASGPGVPASGPGVMGGVPPGVRTRSHGVQRYLLDVEP